MFAERFLARMVTLRADLIELRRDLLITRENIDLRFAAPGRYDDALQLDAYTRRLYKAIGSLSAAIGDAERKRAAQDSLDRRKPA